MVVPWFTQGFAGFLEPLQVLLLWDRVVACDSLEPFAVLAAAIFAFRKHRIMSVRDRATPLIAGRQQGRRHARACRPARPPLDTITTTMFISSKRFIKIIK